MRWTYLLGHLALGIATGHWAPEMLLVLAVCWPVAVLLHHHEGPRQPVRVRNRKDRA